MLQVLEGAPFSAFCYAVTVERPPRQTQNRRQRERARRPLGDKGAVVVYSQGATQLWADRREVGFQRRNGLVRSWKPGAKIIQEGAILVEQDSLQAGDS